MTAAPTLSKPEPLTAPQLTHTELRLGRLGDVRVEIGSTPTPTLISLVAAALGGPSQGVAPQWVRQIRRALPPDDAAAVGPVFSRPSVILPDCLSGLGLNQPMSSQLERFAAIRPDEFRRGVTDLYNGGRALPAPWQPALRQPRRWVDHYVSVLTAAWQAYAPVWRRAAELRARETERVGVAVVSGGLDALLSGLSSRAYFSGETLYLADRTPYRVPLAGRRVVLVPLASGSSASIFNLDEPDLVWFGYPMPGLETLMVPPQPAGTDALTLLLGPIRATILRALARPTTMGSLAGRLNSGPSTATYHCVQLASAGLVVRRRDGREVRVQRTPRGDALVELLS
jgi:DNA-binding transcriptional ArsR family regulator